MIIGSSHAGVTKQSYRTVVAASILCWTTLCHKQTTLFIGRQKAKDATVEQAQLLITIEKDHEQKRVVPISQDDRGSKLSEVPNRIKNSAS